MSLCREKRGQQYFNNVQRERRNEREREREVSLLLGYRNRFRQRLQATTSTASTGCTKTPLLSVPFFSSLSLISFVISLALHFIVLGSLTHQSNDLFPRYSRSLPFFSFSDFFSLRSQIRIRKSILYLIIIPPNQTQRARELLKKISTSTTPPIPHFSFSILSCHRRVLHITLIETFLYLLTQNDAGASGISQS